MIKALTKFGFSAGAITGTICAGETALTESGDLGEMPKQQVRKLSEIRTLEEIDIYAREKGCSFLFVASWGGKQVYNVNEFIRLEKEKDTKIDWEGEAIKVSQNKIGSCQKGKMVVFAWSGKFTIQSAPNSKAIN